MVPYRIILPTAPPVPILISIPHCGTEFPSEIKNDFNQTLIGAPDDTDWFVDKLYDFAPSLGITMIIGVYSRWVIDLNRDPESQPLYTDGRIITGLCPTTTFLGEPLYNDKRTEVHKSEIERRLKNYYRPYHQKLGEHLKHLHQQFGKVLLWDCHSIRQVVPTIQKLKFPDLILGDVERTSASQQLIDIALRNLNSASYSLQHNNPFKGGFITRYFGRPLEQQHALQLEMSKVNYMDDDEVRYDEGRAERMQEVLQRTLVALGDGLNPSTPAHLPEERGIRVGAAGEVQAVKFFRFNSLLQSFGWLSPAFVGVDSIGNIEYLSDKPPHHPVAIEHVHGYVLPGFQNAHSHAFQYAMAGRAETHRPGTSDDFWSWREAMYGCALSMDPDQMQAVATMLYAEMLRKGYTHVAEFHYLHHDKNGKAYHNIAEMGLRLVEAASAAGIKITLIPVFYQKGGFGKSPETRQRRFISKTVDDYFHLLADSAHGIKNYPHANMGFSVHSLRAVDANDIIKTFKEGPLHIPFHLHAAEQLKEVDDAISFLKQRPLEWILNNLAVDKRFNIVHCTHMNDNEIKRLATSGANAVLCPGTEGNLGDGIFRLTEFASHGGNWSIGTDSHICLNPLEDLRWLDYAQRLTTHRRNTFDDGASLLINKTITTGRRAMGFARNEFFEMGQPLDAIVFNAKSPLLSSSSNVLSSIVYTADSGDILGTLINGSWIVKEQRHERETIIKSKFNAALKELQF